MQQQQQQQQECETNVTSSDENQQTDGCALFDFLLYTVVGGLLCVSGIIGNALSFFVLQFKDSSKSSTTFILRALAIADTLVLMAAIPLYALPQVKPYTGFLQGYYDLYLKIMRYLWPLYLIPYTGTILLTVLVSFNRYLAVCKPFRSAAASGASSGGKRRSGNGQSCRLVGIVALFSIIYNIPRFFEYHQVEKCYGDNRTEVIFELSDFGHNKIYRILYANLLYFVVMHGGPLFSLAFLNVKLINALKAQARRRKEMTGGCAVIGGAPSKHPLQQDLTLVLVVVVFVFIFCQTPTFLDHIFWTFVDRSKINCGNWHYYYTALADMFAIFNSSANFVIYVLTSRKFRQGLIAICWSDRCSCRSASDVQ